MARTPGRPGGTDERPAVFFADAAEFRAWLEANHTAAAELWMGLCKRHVVDRGLTWADAVPEALCFGWIDSKYEPIDEDTGRQRWTPRRAGSVWSPVNIALVEQLTADGRMTPAGTAVFEARRADSSDTYEKAPTELTTEHAAALAADPRAAAFWAAATATYRKVCTSWVGSAKKPETRDRRMAQLIEDSAHGRMVKHQRYGDPPKWLERAAAAARAAG